jgi:Mg-chelatase subunit ChlD
VQVEIMEVKRGATRTEFLLLAEPKVRYRVHVYEPKRSIVYLWDVSGSMSSFVASIENAVLKFAREIDPASEKVQLLPFDEPPRFLLENWASDSYTLEGTVRNYDPPGSSYAHLSLKAATDLLKDQEGTKAAIVITDCETLPRRQSSVVGCPSRREARSLHVPDLRHHR